MSQRQQLQLLGTGHFKQFNLPNQTTTQNQALNSLKSQFQPLLNHKNNNKKIWLGGINAARKHSKTLNAFKAQQSTHKVKDESPIRKQKRVKEKKQKLKQAAKYQQTRIQNIREQNKLNSEKKEDLLKCQDISRMFSHSQKKNKFVNKYYDPESLNWEKQIIQKKVLNTQQSPLKPLIKNAANPINYCKAVSQSSRKIKTQESEKKKSVNRQSLQNPKKHTRSRAFSSINGAAKNTLAPQGNARLCKQNSLEFTFGK